MNAAAGTTDAFPWDEVMAIGFGLLRLAPAAFWAMTPREFECAVRGRRPHQATAPGRGDLATLMQTYPDKERLDG